MQETRYIDAENLPFFVEAWSGCALTLRLNIPGRKLVMIVITDVAEAQVGP